MWKIVKQKEKEKIKKNETNRKKNNNNNKKKKKITTKSNNKKHEKKKTNVKTMVTLMLTVVSMSVLYEYSQYYPFAQSISMAKVPVITLETLQVYVSQICMPQVNLLLRVHYQGNKKTSIEDIQKETQLQNIAYQWYQEEEQTNHNRQNMWQIIRTNQKQRNELSFTNERSHWWSIVCECILGNRPERGLKLFHLTLDFL